MDYGTLMVTHRRSS